MQSDRACPHCGEVLRAKSLPRPGWVLFSLAMAGCPAEDLYGAPDTGPPPSTSESGGETSAGETTGNETTGGETTGSETTGGETTG